MQAFRYWLIALGAAVALALPLVSGVAASSSESTPPAPDGWSRADLSVLASMRLSQLPAAPHDPSNAVEDVPAAAALGKRLFNDARFSANQAVSCATCHDPQKQFQDGLPMARGVGQGTRRAMPLAGAAHSPWLFWDGRKDSLWAQALGPWEDAVEHGGNRSRYAHLIAAHYRAEYEAVFQALPDLSQVPPDAGPLGAPAEQQAWRALDAKTQFAVSQVFANMGKAVAAFEKTLTHGTSRFDLYVEGLVRDDKPAQPLLNASEVDGLRLFIGKGQCVTCHNGPLLTDQHFHNTGVPPRGPAQLDRGRAAAVARVQQDAFNCLGRFSDAKPAQCQELRFMATHDPALEGAFKTPSLRNVAERAPYMHAGQFASLNDVIQHYAKAPAAAVGHTERAPLRLSEHEAKDLVAFLGTLSGVVQVGTGP